MTTSIADLVGQSIMLAFRGTRATPDVLDLLAYTRAGGVILFRNNISTPAQLYELVQTLQTHAAELGLPPLFVAIDQEGGNVGRLPAPFATVPSQMAQAATGDPETAAECAAITAQQLRAFGINTNFAPVLDVNNNARNPVIGVRAFGSDPQTVERFAGAAFAGYREAGVIATAKHFPGHGDTTVDSHLGLPVVPHDRRRLEDVELAPFRAAIAAGVPAIMTAHIVFPELDELPATLSRPILTDLLRHKLGFDGVIFTDALEMRALRDRYTLAESAVLSKAAGADVVLPMGPLDEQREVADALRAAVDEGRLPLDLFECTAMRLKKLRQQYQMTHELLPFAEPDQALVAQALDITRRSITLLGDQSVLPLPRTTRLLVVDCMLLFFSAVDEGIEHMALFEQRIRNAFSHAHTLRLGADPTASEIADAQALSTEYDCTLLLTRNAVLLPQQIALGQALAQGNTPLIHAALRIPYDAQAIKARTSLLTYGDLPQSLEALVEVLAGETNATGTLPVVLTR
jgi:beta-N-acetylhexosaminidase